MKKTQLIIILFFIFCPILTFSQKNFVKGYIVNTKYDTLRGYINDLEWTKSPNSIIFKSEQTEKDIKYDASMILGFSLEKSKEIFVSKEFKIEKLSRRINESRFGSFSKYASRNKTIENKKVFVRLLSKGKANLYEFVDSDSEVHFLIEYNYTLEPLVYHIISFSDGQAELPQFHNQLEGITQNTCDKITLTQIKQTKYTSSSLQGFINLFNACLTGSTELKAIKTVKGKTEYGVLLGVNFSSLNMTYPNIYNGDILHLEGNRNFSPAVGLFFTYVLPKNRGKMAIVNELNNYVLKSTINDQMDIANYNMSYLGLKNLIRYKIHIGMPSVFLTAGMLNGFMIKNQNTIKRSTFTLQTNSREVRKHEEGFILGFGGVFNRITIESRYTIGTGFAVETHTKTITHYLEGFLKYNMGKK